MQLGRKDLLSIHDFSASDVQTIMKVAEKLKYMQKNGIQHQYLKGKTLGMIFSKNSTRTRVSFEVGMFQLGGHALFLSDSATQVVRGEPIEDTARVLSRYVDGIMIRTFSHESVVKLAEYATVPVINGLTDLLHPCQALADILTIKEYKQELKGRKLTYIGDGSNNMANSLMFAGAKVGMNVTIACPRDYQPNQDIFQKACLDAQETGAQINVIHDPLKACEGADVLYTDVWTSMGAVKSKMTMFMGYQISSTTLKYAKPDAIVMHCLPAHRGEEITGEAMESVQSAIFDQAENRLHAQKAILTLLMSKESVL